MLSNNMTHGLHCGYRIEDISNHLAAVHGLVEHYGREFALNDLVVRYESLVADPEGQTRRLLDYLGLPFEQACVPKLHDRSIGRYKHYAQHLKLHAARLEGVTQTYNSFS
jgi:hypothetical protein